MINVEKALALLDSPVMPVNSTISISVRHSIITESLEKKDLFTDCLIEKIKQISVGETVKNEIENTVDFDSRESIMDFFRDGLKVIETKKLDINSDVAVLTFSVEIFYGNKKQITKELLASIERMKFKSFFMEVEV